VVFEALHNSISADSACAGRKSDDELPVAWSRWTQGKMMMAENLDLIRTIVLHGGRKYTAGIINRTKYKRLVDLGWLTPFNVNSSDVEYVATDLGRTAATSSP
jgi:hypothetical protein